MPQMQLPVFPKGVVELSSELGVKEEDGQVFYFNGMLPVFVHAKGDINTFRMITSQFCVHGNVKEVDIARTFKVPLITVKRCVKRFREEGAGGFYKPRKVRGAPVLTEPVLAAAQQQLYVGKELKEVAEQLGIKYDTLKKAVSQGRLKKKSKVQR